VWISGPRLLVFIGSYAKCTTIASEGLIIKEKECYVLNPWQRPGYLLARSVRMLAR
jgi:hypothetical protein